MTEEQTLLIKQSWKIFRKIDPVTIGDVFYSKLFLDYPRLRKMFPKNMEAQYKKLTDMLDTIIGGLERKDAVIEDITALAQRHVKYGVKAEHYMMIGSALIWTLKHGLGKDWSDGIEDAWLTCFNTLANTMINASGYSEKVS